MDVFSENKKFVFAKWILTTSTLIGITFAWTLGDVPQEHAARVKRSSNCGLKYQQITSGHTACLDRSSKVKDAGLQSGEAEAIVDIHNTVRREVTPSASNMVYMSWNEEIANTAQRWAENCVINHDPGYKRYAFGTFSVGQNLAWGSPKMSWSQSIKLWSDEKIDFHYGSSPTGVVGHYTQMVWATSAKVGCGYADCDGTHYYVCNYGPAGNSGDTTKPYATGTACGNCPSNCNQGLCQCRNIDVCLNGGTLDFDTCQCSCKKDLKFYLQPKCQLNCTDIKEPFYCGTQWDKSYCARFSNVPQECPKLCDWCPVLGNGRDISDAQVPAPLSTLLIVTMATMTLLTTLTLN